MATAEAHRLSHCKNLYHTQKKQSLPDGRLCFLFGLEIT